MNANQRSATEHQESLHKAMHEYSAIAVVRSTFEVVKLNLVPLLILFSVLVVSSIIAGIISYKAASIVFALFNVVVSGLVTGAIVYIVYKTLIGDNVTIQSAIDVASKHLVQIIVISIVCPLIIGIGAMFLIVPGVILACMFAVTLPACVVESKGIIDSFKRSAELTKEYRLKVFTTLILLGVAIFVFIILAAIAAKIVSLVGITVLTIVTYSLFMVPVYMLAYTFPSVLYFELRAIKDGVTVDKITNVFD